MGIFRYFYWHFNTYPESITYMNHPKKIKNIDILGLDLNAIFHPVCQEYFFDKKMSVVSKKTNKGCYQAICKEIDKLIGMCTPKEELVLAIDGVAGLSKMNQQRQRRFRSSKEKTDDERMIFDSNQISTGTVFIQELSQAIRSYFHDKPYTVTLFDETVIGEGEHKLIRYIEDKKNKVICIYSPDADLIMLGVALHKKNMFILRPNIYSNIKCSHFIVNLDVFKKQLVELIDPTHRFPQREKELINSFVFLLFFLGNDFLPHSPSFEIKFKGIDKILEIYSNLFHQNITLIQSHPYSINTFGFQQLLLELSKVELQMVEYKKKSFKGFPNQLLDRYGDTLGSHFKKYRNEYYQLHFPNVPIQDVCRDYLIGLLFVGQYYYQGMPDYLYQYPYYHGPFFHELYEYSLQIKTEWIHIEFEPRAPVSPIVQLLCVLPQSSCRWLPKPLQVYYEEDSEIRDLFPTDFKIDLDGVMNEYEGIVMLPPIDLPRIHHAFHKSYSQFTMEEKHRNEHDWMK